MRGAKPNGARRDGYGQVEQPRHRVVAFDYRRQAQHPAQAGRARLRADRVAGASQRKEALALEPDGVFLSNGPGRSRAVRLRDPRDSTSCSSTGVPTFGICLGHQLLGLACGARTDQDEVRPSRRQPSGAGSGHRPRVITSQNHGFAVDPATLPSNVRVTHVSSVRRQPARIRADRPAGVLLPGPSGSEPRPARHRLLVRRFIG